jgi:dihydropteroate synthase
MNQTQPFPPMKFRRVTFDWSRPYIVGVVNVTPDSFSDGGRHLDVPRAVARGLALAAAGADVVDVGGESTRPGATPVDPDEELRRVIPVIAGLVGGGVSVVSVDTTKAVVAEKALLSGAELINDVSGGAFDPAIAEVCAAQRAAYVCGHLRGRDLAEVHRADAPAVTFDEVCAELAARIAGLPAGLAGRVIADPGLGFGKHGAVNLELCRRAGELADQLSCPVMVGPSRKRFLGELIGRPVAERDAATVGAALAAASSGAHFLRVHDVVRLVPALTVFRAVLAGAPR